jgi:hypothetical protein
LRGCKVNEPMSNSEPTRTVWTKSIYDGLYLGLQKNHREAVLVAVADLKSKDISMPDILKQVREEKGAQGEADLKRLLSKVVVEKKGLLARLGALFK